MFERARLKLTGWYLAIIMVVSLLFSIGIYTGVDQEFQRIERMQKRMRVRQEQLLVPPDGGIAASLEQFDPDVISHARIRFITVLGFINLAILGFSGAAGYFLAGRTLKPIQEMVDEQNRFITDASHELRTPLTSLRSEIEVGLRNKSMSLKDSVQILKSNLEEVISLQYLSDNLLELSQTGKSSLPLSNTSVSLQSSAYAALKKLDSALHKKHITVDVHVKDVIVSGIPDRITELFVILLDNAIKYSPSKSKISLSAKKEKDSVLISIKDEGVGIEEKDIPFIFDRFYRASKSRSKEDYPGYGLGLAIAHKIVESHHGEISVKSTVNQGTTFNISLPVG